LEHGQVELSGINLQGIPFTSKFKRNVNVQLFIDFRRASTLHQAWCSMGSPNAKSFGEGRRL